MKHSIKTILFISATLTGSALGSFALAGEAADTPAQISLIRDVRPVFPESALRRQIGGYVVAQFDISDKGRAHNIRIVKSQPQRTFDAAVATAIRRSYFEVDAEAEDIERVYRFDAADEALTQQVGMYHPFHQ